MGHTGQKSGWPQGLSPEQAIKFECRVCAVLMNMVVGGSGTIVIKGGGGVCF